MGKDLFVKGIERARKFCLWVGRLDCEGIDLGNEYLDTASEALYFMLANGDCDWDYDTREEFSWIVEYTDNPDFKNKYRAYERAGRVWDLSDPGNLYDFIEYMNKYGWDRP